MSALIHRHMRNTESLFTCAHCGVADPNSHSEKEFEALPDMLCVELSRKRHDPAQNWAQVKMYDEIQIDERLDLHQYLRNGAPGLASYRLYAVEKHRGTVNAGHYVGWGKSPGPRTWFKYDDEDFDPSNLASAMAQVHHAQQQVILTPYVLFYERIPYA